MTDPLSQWRDILERLLKAEGPDRELDDLIAVASYQGKGRARNLPTDGRYSISGNGVHTAHNSPECTANTDAAIALVKVINKSFYQFSMNINGDHPYAGAFLGINENIKGICTTASTLPLSILTALARAEIARLEGEL